MDAPQDKNDTAFAIVVLAFILLLAFSILVFGQGLLFSAQVYLVG